MESRRLISYIYWVPHQVLVLLLLLNSWTIERFQLKKM